MTQTIIETPYGFKAVQTEVENGILIRFVEEEKYEPKDGDIAYSEGWIIIVKNINFQKKVYYHASITLEDRKLLLPKDELVYMGYLSEIERPATPEEQQILFDALSKEGKRWNSEKKCIEDIEQDILVPEEINITGSGKAMYS